MSWFSEYKQSLKLIEVEDYFDLIIFRPFAFILVKLIYRTNITPNQLTVTALIFGFIAAIFYSLGWRNGFLLGALFFFLYNVFDCSDGQLARLKKNGTPAGRIIDGIADYLATLAVFIGLGLGFANHQSNPQFWWWMLLLLALSSVVQAILVDYYRNRFLDYVLQRPQVFHLELASYQQEYEELKKQPGKWLDRIIIGIYLRYSYFQEKITPKGKVEKVIDASPAEYYAKNKLAMRFWVLICSTSEITALIICSLINRIDIFFMIILIGFNGLGIIMWLVQARIDRSFKKKLI